MNTDEFLAARRANPNATLDEIIPPHGLDYVKKSISHAKRTKVDAPLARLMLKHGRMTAEAREWLAREYPQ